MRDLTIDPSTAAEISNMAMKGPRIERGLEIN